MSQKETLFEVQNMSLLQNEIPAALLQKLKSLKYVRIENESNRKKLFGPLKLMGQLNS